MGEIGIGEVGEGGRVGCPGLEDCRCAREDSRDEVENSRGQHNFLARVWRELTRENRKNKVQTEWRRRKKLMDRKRKIQWRVWKREVVVFLQLCTLSELELDRFFFLIIILNKICVQYKDLYFRRSGLIPIPPLKARCPIA